MTSNAYIASDGEKLMKVGKSNNPKRREKQIDLTITLTIGCLDEVSAYKIESQLRQFIVERGGIKHASTVDWFIFDPQIYRMVCEFAGNLDGFTPLSDNDSQEAEIEVLRKKYFQLLADERNPASKDNLLKAENEKLQAEIQELQRDLNQLQANSDRLHQELEDTRRLLNAELIAQFRQLSDELASQRCHFLEKISEEQKEKYKSMQAVSYWEGVFKGLHDSIMDRGQKPIDPEVLLNILNSLMPQNNAED